MAGCSLANYFLLSLQNPTQDIHTNLISFRIDNIQASWLGEEPGEALLSAVKRCLLSDAINAIQEWYMPQIMFSFENKYSLSRYKFDSVVKQKQA